MNQLDKGIGALRPVRVLGQLGRAARSARITPELAWFMASPRYRADPYPAYRRLRRLDPVHLSPLGVLVVSEHRHVTAALRNPALSVDVTRIDASALHLGPLRHLLGRADATEQGPFFDLLPELMLFRDPPDHTRLRALVNRAFTPRRVQELEPRIRALADELLDDLAPGGSAELMGSFAYPFPARVICELLGVPATDVALVVDHAPALAAGLDPGPFLTAAARDAANVAAVELSGYLADLVRRRRLQPGDDLVSALVAPGAEDALTDHELVGTLLLLLIAGHETTANLLGNSLVALLAQPDRTAELRADPGLHPAAVDELLRFDSPVQMTMRIATDAVTIADRTVPAGAIVILCTGAANRDPDVYPHPDRLDWHRRNNNAHLALGGGAHYCLGAPLARAETRIALGALLERLPGLALDGPPVRRPSFTIRALSSLPLRWAPP